MDLLLCVDLRRLRTLIPFLRANGVSKCILSDDPGAAMTVEFHRPPDSLPVTEPLPPPPIEERTSPPKGSIEYVRNRFQRN